jgi:hypothetical protein
LGCPVPARSRRPAGKTLPSGFSPAISSLTTAGSASSVAVTWPLCVPRQPPWPPANFIVSEHGTKVKANASKHKAMSNERMLKSERQLEAEMRALLRKAEIIDAQDDGQYGKGKRGDELPEELQRRSSRLEWIRKAKAKLEAEATAAKAHQREEEAEHEAIISGSEH